MTEVLVRLLLVVVASCLLPATTALAALMGHMFSVNEKRTVIGALARGCNSHYKAVAMKSIFDSGDRDGYLKGILIAEKTGGCRVFRKGESVYVLNVDTDRGFVRVRAEGDVAESWLHWLDVMTGEERRKRVFGK